LLGRASKGVRRRHALVLAVSIAAVVGLALQGLAQTQPEVDVDRIDVREPLAPTETIEVAVNASVSCEGWGRPGAETVAVFAFPDAPSTYDASLEPREVDLPAGPGECESGERLETNSSLALTPSREDRAGHTYDLPIHLVLEERVDGDTVAEYGPYRANVTFQTGFLPDFDVRLAETELQGVPGEPARTEVVVESRANGRVAVRAHVDDVEGAQVRFKPEFTTLDPGEEARLPVEVEDRDVHPLSSTRQEIPIETTLTYRGLASAEEVTSRSQLEVTFAPWYENGEDLAVVGLGAVLLAGSAQLLRRRTPAEVGTSDHRIEPEAVASTVLLVAGALAFLWGTLAGPAAMVAALAFLLAPGAFVAATGRLPERVERRLGPVDPDRDGLRLLGLGVGAFAAALVLDFVGFWVVAGLALIAGAWLLVSTCLSTWGHRAVALVPVLFGLVPLLEAGLVVGVGGQAVARMSVGSAVVELVGAWGPFLLAFAALQARTRGRARAIALAGTGVTAALAVVPDWFWGSLWGSTDLAGVTVTGPVVLVALLAGALVTLKGTLRSSPTAAKR
jgi:hypothetical protein